MTIRILLIGATALFVSAASANAQGKTPKPVVISQTVLKSMMANKPKSKAPLGAKAGLVRKTSVVAEKSAQAAPTSVRAASPIAEKK